VSPAPVAVALDASDLETAVGWAAAAGPHVSTVKVGLELYLRCGQEAVEAVRRASGGCEIFLDLKLHDIPNTVAGAVRSLLPLRPAMLTLHASGGAAMIAAARQAAEAAGAARPIILAVTVLTSMDAATLAETGVSGGPVQQVLRLARIALAAGADGLVCSPQEVSRIRDAFGQTPLLVVPGVRPAGSAMGDQARTATPAEAVAAGADWIVVGRPITGAADPAAAAQAIAESLPA